MNQLSTEQMLECGRNDLRWLIETCFSLVNKDSHKVPFLFNPAQDHYWPRISSRDIILKARKEGFSTIRLARMVAKCMTMKNRHCVVVSHEEKSTQRLLERAVYLLDNGVHFCQLVFFEGCAQVAFHAASSLALLEMTNKLYRFDVVRNKDFSYFYHFSNSSN